MQLYPQDGPPADSIVWREDLPGLRSVLVYNLPGATHQVNRVDAAGWGKSWDELFEVAIKNVFAHFKPTKNNRVELGEVASVLVFEGDELYTATFSLLLERKRRDTVGPSGTLVSVPCNGVLLCHALGSGNVVAAYRLLSTLATEAYQRGPYSLTTKVYWLLKGQFRSVEVTGEGRDTAIYGPPELLDVLNGKGPSGEPSTATGID